MTGAMTGAWHTDLVQLYTHTERGVRYSHASNFQLHLVRGEGAVGG